MALWAVKELIQSRRVQCYADVVGPNLAENLEVNRWA
jgi:hypothetical protein